MAGVPGKPRSPSIFDQEPTYRASMLPIGTYADDTGGEHLGWALPGMITEPVNALMRLAENSRFADGHLGIPNPESPENQQDMTTLLLSLYGGNALNPVAAISREAIAANPNLWSRLVGRKAEAASGRPEIAEPVFPEPLNYRPPDALPMDPETRLARAKAQGFDTNYPLYHGSPADFDIFHPSGPKEALGPGVYVSDNPSQTHNASAIYPLYAKEGQYFHWNGDDVPGSIARASEILPDVATTPNHHPGVIRNADALSAALAERGFRGIDNTWTETRGWDEPTRIHQRVVFDPADLRSVNAAFDPENIGKNGLLLSDTGRPSLMGSAIAGAERNEGQQFAIPTVNIYDPPSTPRRAFEEDYPHGATADAHGRLLEDIDGRPLNPDARFIVGRRVVGGGEEAFPSSEFDALAAALTGQRAQMAAPQSMGSLAAHTRTSAVGNPVEIALRNDLAPEDLPRVYAHELGHAIDRTAVPRDGIPMGDASNPNRASLLSEEFGQVYNDLNNPDASLRGLALPPSRQFNPADLGYAPDRAPAEYLSEAIRAYMADPNYMKSVAPTVAQRIREYVNPHPDLNNLIQFNSDTTPSLLGAALAALQAKPKNSFFDY